ncbi:MAG: monovalent cation/H(+) antiporter subunit G, partial [Haliea sp.]
MAGILDILSWIFLLFGGFLGITGAVGLFRFPDFFTRLHAASVT